MYFLMISSSVVFLYFGTRIVFIEDITKLLPQEGPASKSSFVFGDLKVKDMIMLQVTSDDVKGADLALLSDEFVNKLLEADSTNISNIITSVNTETLMEDSLEKIEEGKEFVRSHIPTFFGESQLSRFDSLLTPEALDAVMKEKSVLLAEYLNEGDFDRYSSTLNMMGEDPAGLLMTLVPSDESEFSGGFRFIDGHIMSADSTVLLSLIAPSFNSMESAQSGELISLIEDLAEEFEEAHPGLEVIFHGLPVNSAYNSNQLKSDVVLTIGISLLIICIVFGLIFHNKSSLPILLAPIAWGTLLALSCMYWIQGTISLLAMGVGALILGVALSYSLHILTHYKYVSQPEKLLKDQSTPVFLGCITTVGAFVALLFTNSALLKDFGIFATLSIVGTVFFSLVFTPHFLRPERNRFSKKVFGTLNKINEYPFDRLVVLRWVIVAVCCICIWGSSKVGFDSNLRHISYQGYRMIRSGEVFAEKFNNGNRSIFFATFADTRDHALELTSKLTQALDSLKQQGKVCSYMDMTRIFVPEKEQQNRIDRWNAYWTPERVETVRTAIEAAAENNLGEDYYPGMFDSFYETIGRTDYAPGSLFELGILPDDIVGYFVDEADGKYLVMTSAVMPHDCLEDVSDVLDHIPEVLVVDHNYYASELVKVVNDDFDKVLGISSVFVLIILLLSFRSVMIALIAFLPMSVSWYVVKGVMGLTGHDFNMINIVIATFIFGVGVDYSIFVMKGLIAKARGEKNSLLIQHKTAILLSAFMLIVALGSLIFASHPAISSVGFTTLIGMSSTVLLTYTIQPALFRFLMKFRFFNKKVTK